MAVALGTGRVLVEVVGQRLGFDHGRVLAQSHRPAHVFDLVLFGQDVDDWMWRILDHLRGVGVLEPEDVPGVLDDGHLEAKTKSQERHVVFAGVANGLDFALGAPHPEATGDDDTVDVLELAVVAVSHLVGRYPVDVYVGTEFEAGVFERLVDRHVRVFQVVLADQRDVDVVLFLGRDDLAPLVCALALRQGLVGESEVL